MGFLESVGVFAIMAVGIILLLRHLSLKESGTVKVDSIKPGPQKRIDSFETSRADTLNKIIEEVKDTIRNEYGYLPEEVDYRKLIKFNKKCQKEINNYNDAVYYGRPASQYSLDKKLKKILKDPLEFWVGMDGYYKDMAKKEKQQRETKKRQDLYFKYKEIVFGIFDTKTYLSKDQILTKIQDIYQIDSIKAEEIFTLWNQYFLIGTAKNKSIPYRSEVYEVYFLLSDGEFEPELKLTRREWLTNNNKILVDNSSDYIPE